MPLFTYRALNADGKEVMGSIEAADVASARSALEGLKMEIKEINETMRVRKQPSVTAAEEPKETIPAFAFEGTDASGTVKRGTVQAPTKKAAFDKIKANDPSLNLSMLSPIGQTPVFNDPDLARWQATKKVDKVEEAPPALEIPVTIKPQKAPTPVAPVAAVNAWKTEKTVEKVAPVAAATQKEMPYYPLVATLRLYAGWLLAWYLLFVAVGYYVFNRQVPADIPIVEGFFLSPLIFNFILATFLFLMFSSLHKILRGGMLTGIVLGIVGLGIFVGVQFL